MQAYSVWCCGRAGVPVLGEPFDSIDPEGALPSRHGERLRASGPTHRHPGPAAQSSPTPGALDSWASSSFPPERRGGGLSRSHGLRPRDLLVSRLLTPAVIAMDGLLAIQALDAKGGFVLAHRELRVGARRRLDTRRVAGGPGRAPAGRSRPLRYRRSPRGLGRLLQGVRASLDDLESTKLGVRNCRRGDWSAPVGGGARSSRCPRGPRFFALRLLAVWGT
jgi:hypothetical protein